MEEQAECHGPKAVNVCFTKRATHCVGAKGDGVSGQLISRAPGVATYWDCCSNPRIDVYHYWLQGDSLYMHNINYTIQCYLCTEALKSCKACT